MVQSGHHPAARMAGARIFRVPAAAGLAAALLLGFTSAGSAEDTVPAAAVEEARPLHQRIDDALHRGVATSLPHRCSDESFIRRASLDFRGLTPSVEEIRSFTSDASPDKRARLLDAFLADPQHTRHLTNVLDVVLMERRAEKNVKIAEWRAWLRGQVAARTPWDQLVRSLLAADGADGSPTPRGAARWLLDREAEPNSLARDTSRLFLGMDLSCAQCHDHPRVADYWQRDYHGLVAFFSRTYLFQPDPMKPAVVGERAEGEATFVSVFTKISGQAKPQLPGGTAVAEPVVAPAEAWVVAPNDKDKSLRPVPRHSRRALLAEPLTTSRAFALNAANRFWASLLGRGVIDPVDLRHAGNPPAADALLETLADGLVALKYDISAYWREVALSQAYQAAYDAPAPAPVAGLDAAALQANATVATAAEHETRRRETAAREAWEPLQLAAQTLESEAAAAAKTVADARPPVDAAAAALAKSRAGLAAQSDLRLALEAAAAQCRRAATVVADAPELQRAAALLQSRCEAAKATQDTLAKEIAAQEADHTTKAAALAAAEALATAVAPKATAARTTAEAAWQAVAAAAESARAARDTARRATRDAARAVALAEAEAAARQREETRRLLATAVQANEAVSVAAASAQAVCAKLPEDKELAAVFAEVQSRQAVTSSAVEATRRSAETAEAAATAAAAALVPRWAEGFALTSLTALSPEQLCWSLLRTTGTLDHLRAQATREWDEKNPAPTDPAATVDPARATARAAAVDALTEEKIRPHEEQFIRLFGNGPGSPQTDFFATSDQALFFENAGLLRSWTTPGGGNLADRLAAIADPAVLAHEMYLAVLNRPPSNDEIAEVASLFSSRPADPKSNILSDALWALLSSTEFRFKH